MLALLLTACSSGTWLVVSWAVTQEGEPSSTCDERPVQIWREELAGEVSGAGDRFPCQDGSHDFGVLDDANYVYFQLQIEDWGFQTELQQAQPQPDAEGKAELLFEVELSVDGDYVPEEEDNCPGFFNPDQDDGDADGFGDKCDDCPEDPGQSDGCPDV